MIPVSMRSFPEQPLAKRQLGKPWTSAGSRVIRAASRHRRWALAITSKLALRSRWPGLHSEAMTLPHPSRRRILRLQTVIQRTHSDTRVLDPALLELKAPGSPGANLRRETNRRFALPQNIVERNHSLVSFVREIVHRTAPAAASATWVRPNRTAELAAKIATPRILQSALGKAEPAAPFALSQSPRSAPGTASRSGGSDASAATLPEIVMHKHRRVEARPVVQPPGVAPRTASAPAPEPPAVIHRTLTRRPAQGFEELMESDPRRHSARQEPNINLAQITDAVLQQLDRRLIAARERVGRM
jgi:hypothetical protein